MNVQQELGFLNLRLIEFCKCVRFLLCIKYKRPRTGKVSVKGEKCWPEKISTFIIFVNAAI